MGAWIAQAGAPGYWLQDGIVSSGLQQYAKKPCKDQCGFIFGGLCAKEEPKEAEEEEVSRRRTVEFMLGPSNYLYNSVQQRVCHEAQLQPPTLHLLDAPPSGRSAPPACEDSTPIELEPDCPLPSGWEKCLDLKTGSIYYLNRSMGWNSLTDPRRSPIFHGTGGRTDLNSWPVSPSTSEVTMEASLKSNATKLTLKTNEKCGGDEAVLDLNLSLHVGQSLPKFTSRLASVVAAANSCSTSHLSKLKAPLSVPTASSSSASITSSPINSSFPFSYSIKPSQEPKPSPFWDFDSTTGKQDIKYFPWLEPKESPLGGGSTKNDHCLFEDRPQNVETDRVVSGGSGGDAHGSSMSHMVTVACANCLMFVMLSESNPKCPRCGMCPDHLDFLQPSPKRAKLGFSS